MKVARRTVAAAPVNPCRVDRGGRNHLLGVENSSPDTSPILRPLPQKNILWKYLSITGAIPADYKYLSAASALGLSVGCWISFMLSQPFKRFKYRNVIANIAKYRAYQFIIL